MFFVFDSIHDRYKAQKMCDSAVSKNPFFIVYCPDKCKTQRLCDKAVNGSLAALKLVPEWFVTNKTIKKCFTGLYADENVLYFNQDFGNVVFSCNEIGVLNIDLNDINLDTNFGEDDLDTIIHIRLLARHIKFEKRKALKKQRSEELMPIASHPKRLQNFCMSEDDKKEIDLISAE